MLAVVKWNVSLKIWWKKYHIKDLQLHNLKTQWTVSQVVNRFISCLIDDYPTTYTDGYRFIQTWYVLWYFTHYYYCFLSLSILFDLHFMIKFMLDVNKSFYFDNLIQSISTVYSLLLSVNKSPYKSLEMLCFIDYSWFTCTNQFPS